MNVLAIAIQEGKEIKETQIEKEVKPLLFAGNMMPYIANPEDATRKLLELINKFDKIAEYKINTQGLPWWSSG